MCSSTCIIQSYNSLMSMADSSAMFFPAIRKWSASLLSRCPWQSGQVTVLENCSAHFWAEAEPSLSCNICMYFTKPS